MSNLAPSQVTSRSNTDLLTLEMIARNTGMSPGARMSAIADVVRDWDRATDGSTGRYLANREASARRANRTLYPGAF